MAKDGNSAPAILDTEGVVERKDLAVSAESCCSTLVLPFVKCLGCFFKTFAMWRTIIWACAILSLKAAYKTTGVQ